MARPALTPAQLDAHRKRLCAAALEIYRRQGYEAVTLREVAAAAGISYTTPYRYFASKEELFSYVRAEVFTHFHEHLRQADPGGRDGILRLRRIFAAFIDFAVASPDDYRLIFSIRQPKPLNGSPLHEARRQTVAYLVEVCNDVADAGQMDEDALTKMHLAWASLHGLLTLHLSNVLEQGRTLDDLITPMLDHLFSSIFHAPSAGPSPASPAATRKRAKKSVTAKTPRR